MADFEPNLEVVDGDSIHLGGDITIKVVETPGHSIGSVTFVLDGLDWAFAADAVQMYGGASGLPTIENPTLYRKSVQRLLEEVRPKRLYLRSSIPQYQWRYCKVHKLRVSK